MPFTIGDMVQYIRDLDWIGTVIGLGPHHAGSQWYRVHWGENRIDTCPEEELRLFNIINEPWRNLQDGIFGGYREFQRLMTYQRLQRENPLRNNIYAFNASRTRLLPYQFKPLLKFLESENHRLLICDEVGLGKTIEAGLILTELRARQYLHRVLIICPSKLKEKWHIELRKRFGEEFTILTSQDFLRFLNDFEENPDTSNLKGIIALESIRQRSIQDRLEELSPFFDLLIIDEAHHMRNYTLQRSVGVLLGGISGSILLLTATPIHLGNQDLFSLLNILDDEDFPNEDIVLNRLQNNEPIVMAQTCLAQIPPQLNRAIELINQASNSNWVRENPLHIEILTKLKELNNNNSNQTEFRRLQIQAQRDLTELNLIGHVFTRTRKREVQENFPIRRAYPLRLNFTQVEKKFYDAVTNFVREASQQRTDIPIIQKWMLNTPQRRMASCIPAMVDYYRRNLGISYEDAGEDNYIIENNSENNEPLMPGLEEARQRLRSIISRWPSEGPDSKYQKFIEILKNIKSQSQEGICKVIVFAFFKDTLYYLQKRLKNDGIESILICGDIPIDDYTHTHPNQPNRNALINEFKTDPNIIVLLSSRVGSEGLDFQFCNTLFNYDLPWNPMEVEQRIGRLDRIGQESQVINIYNFWIEDTIEQRILERLYERIKIFERSIGELEAILGDELQALERDLISTTLTPDEEEARIERTALIIENTLQQVEVLQNEAAQFIGTDHYFIEEVGKINKYRRYITGEQLRHFLLDFIQNYCQRTRLIYDNIENKGIIYPDNQLLQIINRYGGFPNINTFLGATDGVKITFDSKFAFANPEVEFINVLHPLTTAVYKFYEEQYRDRQRTLCNASHIVLNTQSINPGFYFYFVFRLKIKAVRGGNTLEMILLDEDLKNIFSGDESEIIMGEMVEQGADPQGARIEIAPELAENAYNKAVNIFLIRIENIKGEIERNNDAFVERRLSSLRTFYNKNLERQRDLLKRGIESGRQERYLRMLRGTIARLERELEEKTNSLEMQREIGVNYDEIAAGILEIP